MKNRRKTKQAFSFQNILISMKWRKMNLDSGNVPNERAEQLGDVFNRLLVNNSENS